MSNQPEVLLFARRNGAELVCPLEDKHLTEEGRQIAAALRFAVNQACDTLSQKDAEHD